IYDKRIVQRVSPNAKYGWLTRRRSNDWLGASGKTLHGSDHELRTKCFEYEPQILSRDDFLYTNHCVFFTLWHDADDVSRSEDGSECETKCSVGIPQRNACYSRYWAHDAIA